jgi:hypothetical protein
MKVFSQVILLSGQNTKLTRKKKKKQHYFAAEGMAQHKALSSNRSTPKNKSWPRFYLLCVFLFSTLSFPLLS